MWSAHERISIQAQMRIETAKCSLKAHQNSTAIIKAAILKSKKPTSCSGSALVFRLNPKYGILMIESGIILRNWTISTQKMMRPL